MLATCAVQKRCARILHETHGVKFLILRLFETVSWAELSARQAAVAFLNLCGAWGHAFDMLAMRHHAAEAEVQADFLHDVFEQTTGREPASFLEIGCGPAQHSQEMADSDIQVFCVDNDHGMLAYANKLARDADLDMTTIEQDMRTFALPVRVAVLLYIYVVNNCARMLPLSYASLHTCLGHGA
jgi:SAM-dependent methyltransferase